MDDIDATHYIPYAAPHLNPLGLPTKSLRNFQPNLSRRNDHTLTASEPQ